MVDINIDELIKIFEIAGASNISKIGHNNEIEIRFDEGFIQFKVVADSFQILNFNIYKLHRFNPENDFKALSKEIINSLILYCRNKGFVKIEALNIIIKARSFWKDIGFILDNNNTNGIFYL